jgi:hypothetical protein
MRDKDLFYRIVAILVGAMTLAGLAIAGSLSKEATPVPFARPQPAAAPAPALAPQLPTAGDTITDPVAIADMIRIVNERGYFCDRSIGAWVIGIDGSYGPTFELLCNTGDTYGVVYKVSVPTRGRYVVRVQERGK